MKQLKKKIKKRKFFEVIIRKIAKYKNVDSRRSVIIISPPSDLRIAITNIKLNINEEIFAINEIPRWVYIIKRFIQKQERRFNKKNNTL